MAIEMRSLCPLIQVYDMPTAIRFYRDVLGFEIFSTSPPRGADDFDWCWLKRGGAELMLNTAYESDARPHAPDPVRRAGHDDVCLYIGCPDVDAAYDELRAKRLDVKKPKVAHYGMKQLYLKDPDGYVICFQWSAETETSGDSA